MSTRRGTARFAFSIAVTFLTLCLAGCLDSVAPRSLRPRLALTLAAGAITQITTDPFDQLGPDISGERLVWMETSSDGTNVLSTVHTYDLTSGVERGLGSGQYPAVSGDRIAWLDGFSKTLILFDLGTETRTTLTTTTEGFPSISGDYVVWSDSRAGFGRRDVYIYDVAAKTERRISANGRSAAPDISGDRVVWSSDEGLYMFDLSTGVEAKITPEGASPDAPSISGNRIVWSDRRDGNREIYMYDISTGQERRLTSVGRNDWHVEISGDRIVWIRQTDTGSDVLMYDLTTNTESEVAHGLSAGSARIWGDRIVWHDHLGYADFNIFLFDFSRGVVPGIGDLLIRIDVLVRDGSISSKGFAEGLRALLAQAEAAATNGNSKSAESTLRAFIRLLEAQSGRNISAPAAQVLIMMANSLIASL